MQRVVIIGGGMSGLAAAWRLSELGLPVVVLEQEQRLGGLARTFEQDGRIYPLGYHHILAGDRALIHCLRLTGLLPRVRWSFQRMGFAMGGGLYNLSNPLDLLRLPLPLSAKWGMARVAAAALLARDAAEHDRQDAASWITARGGQRLLREFYEPLAQLKFGARCSELSAAWLRARVCAWEGVGRLGHIPGVTWTHQLVSALSTRIEQRGGQLRAGQRCVSLGTDRAGRLDHVELASGERVRAARFICTLAPPALTAMLPQGPDRSALGQIRYTRAVSCIVGTPTPPATPFYWTNFLQPRYAFGGLFRLDLLNPDLGPPGLHLVNFVTHLGARQPDELYEQPDESIIGRYLDHYRRCFGHVLTPRWIQVSRISHYSPVFTRGYRNPPLRSQTHRNLYFAGNYRTFPRVTSTGPALDSGWEAARVVAGDVGIT